MIAAAEQAYVSIHALAAELQFPAKSLEHAAIALGIAPALQLNQIRYFDHEQAEAIAAHLRGNGRDKMVATPKAERLVPNNNTNTLVSE